MPNTCYKCGNNARKLCDGNLIGLERTCDRPMCDACAHTKDVGIACVRSGKNRGARPFSVDYCDECVTWKNRDPTEEERSQKIKRRILAVTLIRPWGYAIAHLDKRIENRTWSCYLKSGDYIAIHNGKKWDEAAADFIRRLNPSELIANPTKENDPASAIIAIATFQGNVHKSDSPWFCGPVGWELGEVVPIDPVPCTGRQGLWALPDEVLQQVRINYAQACQSRQKENYHA